MKLEVNGLVLPLESWCIDMYRLCFMHFHALCIRLLVGLDGDKYDDIRPSKPTMVMPTHWNSIGELRTSENSPWCIHVYSWHVSNFFPCEMIAVTMQWQGRPASSGNVSGAASSDPHSSTESFAGLCEMAKWHGLCWSLAVSPGPCNRLSMAKYEYLIVYLSLYNVASPPWYSGGPTGQLVKHQHVTVGICE